MRNFGLIAVIGMVLVMVLLWVCVSTDETIQEDTYIIKVENVASDTNLVSLVYNGNEITTLVVVVEYYEEESVESMLEDMTGDAVFELHTLAINMDKGH